jgi:hypothetical protein
MKNIVIASTLMISLSLMTANAGGCAAAHHPAKQANKKRRCMRGAFIGAYQR